MYRYEMEGNYFWKVGVTGKGVGGEGMVGLTPDHLETQQYPYEIPRPDLILPPSHTLEETPAIEWAGIRGVRRPEGGGSGGDHRQEEQVLEG